MENLKEDILKWQEQQQKICDGARKNKVITVRPNGTRRVTYLSTLPSLTDQSFAEEVNVNSIMAKYQKTKQITHLNSKQGVYADLADIPDLGEALMTVKHAERTFLTLPAETRELFKNDPQNLIAYLQDENNLEDSYKIGLRVKPTQSLEDRVANTIENTYNKMGSKNDDSNDDKKAPKTK